MGMYKYVREAWKKPKTNMPELWRSRLIAWRKEPVCIRLDKPTRIDRARSLGYKAKQGYIIIRQRVDRGGRQRETIRHGRRSKHFGQRKDLDKSYQSVAEERVSRKYPNCEVLNSYYVGEDGICLWYEVILVDRVHPQTLADSRINWIFKSKHKGRAFRGLTSAAKKSRGLRNNKGKGVEKFRPSKTANLKRRQYN